MFQLERMAFFYLPRICNHCLNPACVAACPSGAIYKRGEDGVVLINQNVCRAWRMCVTACPYKKTYYNWSTGQVREVHPVLPAHRGGSCASVHAFVCGSHSLPGRPALRCRQDRKCGRIRRAEPGRPADGHDPRSLRSRGHRRGEGQWHRRLDHRRRAILPHL